MKKYKIWVHIKEIDEEEDYYADVENEIECVGGEFDTLYEAQLFRDHMVLNAMKPLYKRL